MRRWKVVEAFADEMQRQLNKNRRKGGWREDSLRALLGRLYEEADELEEEIVADLDPDRIRKEAADVANFAMMIADVARQRTKESK